MNFTTLYNYFVDACADMVSYSVGFFFALMVIIVLGYLGIRGTKWAIDYFSARTFAKIAYDTDTERQLKDLADDSI